MEEVLPQLARSLEGLHTATEVDKDGTKGTRSSLGRGEEMGLYLARRCNTALVEACPDIGGKDLPDALARMCAFSKASTQ